jgi:hypothetical protein
MVGRVLAHGPIFCEAPDVFGVAMVLHWRIFGSHDRLDHAVPCLCHLFVCHLTHIPHYRMLLHIMVWVGRPFFSDVGKSLSYGSVFCEAPDVFGIAIGWVLEVFSSESFWAPFF